MHKNHPTLIVLAVIILGRVACHAQFGYVEAVPIANKALGSPVPAFGGTQLPIAPGASGPYLQLEGTTFNVSDSGFTVEGAQSALKFDNTYGVTGTVGKFGASGLGLEASVGYYQMNVGSGLEDFIGSHHVDVSAKLMLVPVFVNARYSLSLMNRFSLELGAGIGGAYADATATARAGGAQFSDSASAVNFAYQFMAGVGVNLAPGMDLTFQYRYMVFPGADFDIKANSLGLGLRLRL
jgi:opacity protein-like surface antigen